MGNDSIYSQFASMFKIYGSYLTSKLTSILDGLQLPRQLIVKPYSGGLELHIQETPQKGWCPHDDKCYPIIENTIPWAGFYPRGYSIEKRSTKRYQGSKTLIALRINEGRAKDKKSTKTWSVPHSINRKGTHKQKVEYKKYSSLFR